MKKSVALIAFLIPLTVSCSGDARPEIRSLKLVEGSGPLPPVYQWDSTLEVSLDANSKTLAASYRLTNCCEGMEIKSEIEPVACSVKLDAQWYDELMAALSGVRRCKSVRKEIIVGGGIEELILTGGKLGSLVKSGAGPEGDTLKIDDSEVCGNSRSSWNLLGQVLSEMKNACAFSSGQMKPRVIGCLEKTTDGRVDESSATVDPVARTATVHGAGKVQVFDKAYTRGLVATASAVNYYGDFEYASVADVAKRGEPGLYFSPSDGRFFPLSGGIEDPMGMPGGKKAVEDFCKKLISE